MSQNDQVLSRLKLGPLTPMEAWAELGVYRLSARIYELREQGVNIMTNMIEHNDKRYAQYRLIRGHGTG